jgi:archaellum component FlaC
MSCSRRPVNRLQVAISKEKMLKQGYLQAKKCLEWVRWQVEHSKQEWEQAKKDLKALQDYYTEQNLLP